jgi:hypothetical protein
MEQLTLSQSSKINDMLNASLEQWLSQNDGKFDQGYQVWKRHIADFMLQNPGTCIHVFESPAAIDDLLEIFKCEILSEQISIDYKQNKEQIEFMRMKLKKDLTTKEGFFMDAN